MIISLIVAASENNVIGKNNQLLWRLPNDTRFFKNTTWAMPVIMGRKTIESAKQTDCKEAFVIGGGQIYAEAISIADKIYMTRVHAVLDGDAFFPAINEDE